MTMNDYGHHSGWNDRNETKVGWMTAERQNEVVAQTTKNSSHSTHFDVIRLILEAARTYVNWGWLINDMTFPASQWETNATFQNKVCIGEVTIKHRAWCPYVTIDYPASLCEMKATFQNWVCIGEVTIKHRASCPYVIIDYPARQCETNATFQN